MDSKIFTLGLRTVSAVMPYAKKLQDDEAQFLWLTLDQRIKDNISNEMWTYAVKNYLESSYRDETLSVHMDILRIFIKQQNGTPCLDWGFRCNHDEFLQGLQMEAADPYRRCALLYAEDLAEPRMIREAQERHRLQADHLAALSQGHEEPTEDFLGLRSLPSA